eukprot:858339-Pyramimonas_sp.AAC.1
MGGKVGDYWEVEGTYCMVLPTAHDRPEHQVAKRHPKPHTTKRASSCQAPPTFARRINSHKFAF